MANIKSNQKSIRKYTKRAERNKSVKTALKTLKKKLLSATDATARQQLSSEYASALDKAAKRGVIHANKANRHKSMAASLLVAA